MSITMLSIISTAVLRRQYFMRNCLLTILILCFGRFLPLSGLTSTDCPTFCDCSILNKSSTKGLAIKCNDKSFEDLDNFTFAKFPKETVEELDLSGNGIVALSEGVFDGFSNLRKLSLAGNQLQTLQASWFIGLERLEKLSLANNLLKFIPERSLERLEGLRFLDISSPYLTCDCRMRWFRRWIVRDKTGPRRVKVALSRGTVCHFPARLRGLLFGEVRRKDLECGGRLDPAFFAMEPAVSRFVAESDSVKLRCGVSTMSDSEVLEWIHNDRPLSPSSNYEKRNLFYDAGRRHVSELTIKELAAVENGNWTCRLETSKGYVDKSISIFILRNFTGLACGAAADQEECYSWSSPTTTVPQSHHSNRSEVNASRTCDGNATSTNSITDQCDFSSSITRRLKILSDSYDSRKKENEPKLLDELENATAQLFDSDHPVPDDVDLVVQLIEKIGLPISSQRENLLHGMISGILKVDPIILNRADQSFRTTQRLLNVVNTTLLPVTLSEFAIEDCAVAMSEDANVVVVYKDNSKLGVGNEFGCRWEQRSNSSLSQASLSMEISVNFASDLRASTFVMPLRFLWFRNSRTLSSLVWKNSSNDFGNWIAMESAIGVISSRFADIAMFTSNVSSGSMLFRWRILPRRGFDPRGVRLARLSNTNEGSMHWTEADDCEAPIILRHSILFSCPFTSGIFALIHQSGDGKSRTNWTFLLAPWTLAVTGFSAACLVMTAFTHCLCRRGVQSSVKLSHAMVNCWISLAILILTFALGIDRTANEMLCMLVAIVLHYLTLATLLWMFLVVRILQRKLRKIVHPKKVDADDDEMVSYGDGRPKPRHGPLVGMYFLAWGLSGMPCSFTLPLRIDAYTSNANMCFMEPSVIALVAFAAPASILVLVISLLLLCGFRLQNEMESRQSSCHAVGADVVASADEIGSLVISRGPNETGATVDALSAISTEIGDGDGGARRHLNVISSLFALTLVGYGFVATFVLRPWNLVDLGHLDVYWLWSLGGVYTVTILVMGATVLLSYVVFHRPPKSGAPAEGRDESKGNRSGVALPPSKDAVTRKAPHRRRSRPPTTTNSFMDRQSKGDHEISMDFQSDLFDRRTANVGTTVTRPPSQMSGTVAPSGTNVSTARSQRVQQAAAKKYYEKQRVLKMNTSAAADEEMAMTPCLGEDGVIDGSFFDGAVHSSTASRVANDPMSGDISDRNDVGSISRDDKRRPSVELYKKPSKLAAPVETVTFVGHQSASDEDSVPEALRNLDDHGSDQNIDFDGSNDARNLSARVCAKNETRV